MSENFSPHEEHRIYNNHSLYVFTSIFGVEPKFWVKEDEIRVAFQLLVDEATEKYGPEMKTTFRINYVEKVVDRFTKETEPAGYAFIYFTNPNFFNMVIGRKPDGTDLVEFIPDPNWTPLVQKADTASELGSESGSWADQSEAEIDAPMLRRVLPPMLSEPFFERDGTKNPFSILAAYVAEPSEDVDGFKLMSKTPVPSWIDESLLKKYFQFYSSNGVVGVKFTKQRRVIILYSPSNNDGLFARQMTYVSHFVKNDRYGASSKVTIIWDHPRSQDCNTAIDSPRQDSPYRGNRERRYFRET